MTKISRGRNQITTKVQKKIRTCFDLLGAQKAATEFLTERRTGVFPTGFGIVTRRQTRKQQYTVCDVPDDDLATFSKKRSSARHGIRHRVCEDPNDAYH